MVQVFLKGNLVNDYSNALANITLQVIGRHQKFCDSISWDIPSKTRRHEQPRFSLVNILVLRRSRS